MTVVNVTLAEIIHTLMHIYLYVEVVGMSS